MQGTHSGLTLPGTGNLVTGRAWIRWGVAAAVTGCWHGSNGVALIPLDAKPLAQRGASAPDGIIAALVPLTTVIWILALAATLPRSWRAATAASPASARTGQGTPDMYTSAN